MKKLHGKSGDNLYFLKALNKKIKISDFLAEYLYSQGVTHVFEVVGGMITHLIDSIHKKNRIKLMSTHHEQAAAFAAEGFARMTGIPGVALATSGPGATNLLTSMGSCYFDSVPAVFITGQVNRSELKGNLAIRQLGFQEADIVSMASPITKAAWQIQNPDEVPLMITKAFNIASSGRPGPVLLDIPMDVQRLEITLKKPTYADTLKSDPVDKTILLDLIEDLKKASAPLILVGGGINAGRALKIFRKFTDKVKIPVVNSLMAVDALPYRHKQRIGLIGSYGNRWANLAIGKADFLLVLGSRLDIRQTGFDVNGFKSGKTIYHVDCEAGEINNRVTGCKPIIANLGEFLSELLECLNGHTLPDRSSWIDEIRSLKNHWPDTEELHKLSGINPNHLMHLISKKSGKASAYVVDVGQHQMWSAQSLELNASQRFLTTGGMGAMGFALPAAIGVSMAAPDQPVIMIAGDGSFQLNLQELQTIKHHKLPVKMIVLNNNCYGMVRQFQQSYFKERYPSTYWGYSAPDFTSIANGYGIKSKTVSEPDEIMSGIKELWQNPLEPFLLQVMLDTFTNVFPKIAFGLPITEMEPFAKPIAMEGT